MKTSNALQATSNLSPTDAAALLMYRQYTERDISFFKMMTYNIPRTKKLRKV